MKLKILSLVVVAMALTCSSPGVEKVSSNIYQVEEDYYVKKVIIEGDKIYFRCDTNGNILSSPIHNVFKKGKTYDHISFPE
jgi:hypothetical protein